MTGRSTPQLETQRTLASALNNRSQLVASRVTSSTAVGNVSICIRTTKVMVLSASVFSFTCTPNVWCRHCRQTRTASSQIISMQARWCRGTLFVHQASELPFRILFTFSTLYAKPPPPTHLPSRLPPRAPLSILPHTLLRSENMLHPSSHPSSMLK